MTGPANDPNDPRGQSAPGQGGYDAPGQGGYGASGQGGYGPPGGPGQGGYDASGQGGHGGQPGGYGGQPGGYGGQQGGYGGQPSYQPAPSYPTDGGPMPDGYGSPPAGPPPKDVQTSVKLWFASIALALVAGLLSLLFTDRDVARQALLDSDAGLSASQADTAVTISVIGGFFFVVVIAALQLLFVFKMRAGRNWARIVLTVLGALAVIFGLFGFTAGFTIGSLVNLVSILLIVGAIVLMYRPAASAYFAAGSRR